MKKATCKQLAGACDAIITGSSPEEMATKSKQHAIENMDDKAHRQAMEAMRNMSKKDREIWYENFVKSFNSLEDA